MKTRINVMHPLALLICLSLSIGALAQDAPNPVIAQANRLLDTDRPIKALKLLNDEVAKTPTAALWYYVGVAQIKNGQPEEAAKSFDKSVAADEKEALGLVGKGLLLMQNNKPDEAKIQFDKALALSKSKNPVVLKEVAKAYLTNIKYGAQAQALLEKAKSANKNDAETFLLLGDAFLAQNNGGSAVSNYETAASLDPKNGAAHYRIGLVYIRSKNLPVSEQAFIKATQVDPEYTLAYKELGEAYYMAKEGKKAVEAYEKYLALTDKPEAGNVRMAFFYFMARDFAKANALFETLVQKPEVSPLTLRYYAISLYEAAIANNKDAAGLEKSLTAFNNYFAKANEADVDAGDYKYVANIFIEQKQDSLAINYLQKSLAKDPKQFELTQLYAETAFKLKKYPEAVDGYKKLIALRPKPSTNDYYTLGRAGYLSQQYQLADTAFRKVIELQPTMTVGYLWEARTQAQLDPDSKNGLAKPFYEQLIEKSATVAPDKSKNDLIESNSYLGYFALTNKDLNKAKEYYNKVLALDPANEDAKKAIAGINAIQNPPKK